MQKKYKIYEKVATSLESRTVGLQYGDSYLAQSFLFRSLSSENWERAEALDNGFWNIEDAERFIEDNIPDWQTWIILTEYSK